MSKIAKIPVIIKEGVIVSFEERNIKVSGSKGNLIFKIPEGINVEIAEGKVLVSQQKKNDIQTRPLFGLTRSIIANMIKGVSVGFERKLELSGVGYRAAANGSTLTLFVGFSHPVVIKDENVNFVVEENVITVSGVDKIKVGDIAAKVRNIRPPEPYKGKGIKYQNERIRRKAGKAAKAIGAVGVK